MATTLDLLNQVCERCREDYAAQFGVNPRPGPEIIAGDRIVTACCFVRDEIHFLGNGRLIFAPSTNADGRKGWCQRYAVVCRKLRIVGGNKPGGFNPCAPDDPGSDYKDNNVITWQGRLAAATSGSNFGSPAATGEDHDINEWSDWGGGDDGKDGGTGSPGAKGNPGAAGESAPGSITVIALEIEVVGLTSHLSIDWDGQVGGNGGRGQQGGQGGDGMRGRKGATEDPFWTSEYCSRDSGDGGNGGDGGIGGDGGNGGAGGRAGDIYVISTAAQIAGGPLVSGSFSYVNDGGSGGSGGLPGKGGLFGKAGKAGQANHPCGAGNPGDNGDMGPDSVTDGTTGANGGGANVEFHEVIPHNCSDPIPLPVVAGALAPNRIPRGFASPKSTDASLPGSNLAQVNAVTASLAGVAVSIKPASTDTQLELQFDVAGNSALGACDLTLNRVFGPPAVLVGAATVQRFEVLSIAPATGARGASVAVTITGTAFDPAAAVQNVNFSGTGVNAINIAVINDTTVQCVADIGGAAALGQRDLTVSIGGLSHTLVNAFQVTA